MSDQNQFDQVKQKILHYWGLFLAACGRLWDKVKLYSGKAAAWVQAHTKVLVQKVSELTAAAGEWLKKCAAVIGRYWKRLLQLLAGWLLLAKEKTAPVIQKVRAWLDEMAKRLPKPEAKQIEEPAPQPQIEAPAEAVVADEPAADPGEVSEPEAEAASEVPVWRSNPWMVKIAAVFGAIGFGVKFVFKWICRLYKFIMAAPVVWMAVKFAMQNMERLPEKVGLDIQSTGEFARMITRQQAVYWPLGITMFCLVLMFCAKKPILPWVISIFTLVLPWLIWILNYYA